MQISISLEALPESANCEGSLSLTPGALQHVLTKLSIHANSELLLIALPNGDIVLRRPHKEFDQAVEKYADTVEGLIERNPKRSYSEFISAEAFDAALASSIEEYGPVLDSLIVDGPTQATILHGPNVP